MIQYFVLLHKPTGIYMGQTEIFDTEDLQKAKRFTNKQASSPYGYQSQYEFLEVTVQGGKAELVY